MSGPGGVVDRKSGSHFRCGWGHGVGQPGGLPLPCPGFHAIHLPRPSVGFSH